MNKKTPNIHIKITTTGITPETRRLYKEIRQTYPPDQAQWILVGLLAKPETLHLPQLMIHANNLAQNLTKQPNITTPYTTHTTNYTTHTTTDKSK